MASVKKKADGEVLPAAEALDAGDDGKATEKSPPLPVPVVSPAPEAIPAVLQSPPPVVAPPAPAPPPAKAKALYRVWPHGTLQHNGKTYQPGDELSLHEDEASKIPCLVKVDG